MLSPFFAWFFNSAKIRSCLRIRFAPSISLVLAISTSSVTGLDFRPDRCMVLRVASSAAALAAALLDSGFDAGDGTAPVMASRGPEGGSNFHPLDSPREA